jgi:hypothetical protein
MCTHSPRCPSADAIDWWAARNVAEQPGQGWTLLCNGVVVFDDLGALLPEGRVAAIPDTPGGRLLSAAGTAQARRVHVPAGKIPQDPGPGPELNVGLAAETAGDPIRAGAVRPGRNRTQIRAGGGQTGLPRAPAGSDCDRAGRRTRGSGRRHRTVLLRRGLRSEAVRQLDPGKTALPA